MKTQLLIFVSCLLCSINITAQQNDSIQLLTTSPSNSSTTSEKTQLNFYGHIRSDIFYDSRQNIGAGENVVPIYPSDQLLDINGEDINSSSKFHMLSIISRGGVNVIGPKILEAKTSGVLEGEFFGATEGGINQFRLRHAYMILDWGSTTLGIGQYWHPFVVLEALPNIVNYGTGTPVYALNRNPQIRLTNKLTNELSLTAAIHSQRDFSSNTEPFRNSSLPAAHLQLQYKTKNFIAGIAGQYENLKPKLNSSTPLIKSKERVESYSGMAYLKAITKPLTITTAIYSMQDASTFVMLGGIVGYQKTGEVEKYKTINTLSYWIDLQQNSNGKITTGLFAGLVNNKGVNNPIDGSIATTYGITSKWGGISASENSRTVNYLYKIVPRLDYLPHKSLKLRLELDVTTAQWADATNKAIGDKNKFDATNYRVHLTTLFTF